MVARFFLVRHGETAWNREDRMRGWADAPLNDRGRRQARAVGEALAEEPLVAVYTSPLSRAVHTAEAIARPHGLRPLPFEPIKDFHFGAWEGKLRSEVKTAWPELYRVYETDPASFQAPGGETLADLHARVLQGLRELAEKHEGETVALSSHAVTCQIAILAILGLGPGKYWNVKQGNCAINAFHVGPRGWVLEKMNDTGHLESVE